MGDIPNSPAELKQWLFDRFQEKDRLLEGFYSKGTFKAFAD